MSKIELPEALHLWREWLTWFAPELALEVGKLLLKLSPLLGRFQGHLLGGEPEPDGLGDLMRRGNYQRLLSSEWLLADELPDEFLRRAADSEHLFLAPRPLARQAEKRIFALFDAGPMQLGAPRLAHLACWVLLARRAQQSGAEFCWGIVQQSQLYQDTDAKALHTLLQARCYELAQEQHWQHWQNALPEQPGESWLIGDKLLSSAQFTHQLRIQPDLDGASLQLEHRLGSAQRSMRLPLPAAEYAVPLLQGKFLTYSAAPSKQTTAYRLSISNPPVIAETHVAVVLSGEPAAAIFAVPKDKQKVGKARKQSWKGGSVLGLALQGKSLIGVMEEEERLRFWQLPGLAYSKKPPIESWCIPSQRKRWLAIAWLKNHSQSQVYLLDEAQNLWAWHDYASDHRIVKSRVLALRALNKNCLLYLNYDAGTLYLKEISHSKTRIEYTFSVATQPKAALVACGRNPLASVVPLAACLQHEPIEIWRVFTMVNGRESDSQDITLPSDSQAIALLQMNPSRHDFALVLLNKFQRKLSLLRGKQTEELYCANNRIVQHAICAITGNIALLTDQHQLIVYSTQEREVKLFVESGKEQQ